MKKWLKGFFKLDTPQIDFERIDEAPTVPRFVITFSFVKQGVDYNLERQYEYNDEFIEMLRSVYNIVESNNEIAIDRFLSLGLLPSNSNSIDFINFND